MNEFDLDRLPADVKNAFDALVNENERLKKKLSDLSTVAQQDELTGLMNRRGFLRALEKALAFSKRYDVPACLVFIDLNGFKEINDIHGHAAGDIVLKAVGQRLYRQVRSSDVVARLGGDEFVVLFWQVSEETARSRSGLLMHAISRDEVVVSNELSIQIKASAGVAVAGVNDTAEALLERADQAMYQVKAQFKQAV